jgi:hypothetical protein
MRNPFEEHNMHGNDEDARDLLAALPTSIDCVITDPMYGGLLAKREQEEVPGGGNVFDGN